MTEIFVPKNVASVATTALVDEGASPSPAPSVGDLHIEDRGIDD